MLCALRASSQDYIEYQRILNRCDNDILNSDLRTALRRMDTIDRGYEFIYARHCVKGAQIALQAGDSLRTAHWLRRAMLRGVPAWAIRRNPVCLQALRWELVRRVMLEEDSLKHVYLSRIDTVLAREIEHMSTGDAWYTKRVNDGFFPLRKTVYGLQWLHNNTRQVRRLESIIRERGYPDERLIGLPSTLIDSVRLTPFMRRAGIDLLVEHRQVFFMFLHYFTTRRDDLNALLLPQIAIGNMPAYQYARINDYLCTATSRRRYLPYYDQRMLEAGGDTTGLDARRATIGLSPIAEGQRNRNIKLKREFSGHGDEGVVLE